MKRTLLTILLVQAMFLTAIEKPKIHSSIMLDAKFYSGSDSNSGLYDTSNRYQIRKAVVELEGKLTDHIEYGLEYGVSTCSGGGVDLKLMEAALDYDLGNGLAIGLRQGHVLRGFAGATECSDRLTLEKPLFHKTFATCHPTGFVLGYRNDIPLNSAIEFEAGFMNGPNGTLDGEHDYNFGTILTTPVEGLSLSLNYNHTANNYYRNDGTQFSDEGYRGIAGLKYENYNFIATGEFYTGEGFTFNDQEMKAAYVQTGYSIKTGMDRLNAITPYIQYEYWDKNSDLDDESEYSYFSGGLLFSLDSYTKLRFDYFTETDKPSSAIETPDSFNVRLQLVF